MATIIYFDNLSILTKRGLVAVLLGSMSAMLASCGGSGAAGGDPLKVGELSILPNTGSFYANVPITLNVAGGRGPYFITSNEQTVLPLNFQLNGNTFSAVPNNPGVTDTPNPDNQTPEGATPFRPVVVTVRDAAGLQVQGIYNVFQNFLTGYGLSVSSVAVCDSAAVGVPQACAGEDSLISLRPISNGLRLPNKQFRLSALLGAFAFIVDSTGVTGPTVTVTTDERGETFARIRITANAITQYAAFRMTDVATGAYRDFTFIIKNANGSNIPLSILPKTVALSGATTAQCGTGLVNVFIFGGKPPYTADTSFPNSISITPPSVTRSGDAFSVQVFNPNICLGPGNVIFKDAAGAFVSMDITTTAGTVAPVLPLSVAPSSICVPDGGSAVVSISGGNDAKVINSSNPSLAVAVPTVGTGSFTPAINSLGAGGALGTLVTLTINDGANSATVNVTRKTTCP